VRGGESLILRCTPVPTWDSQRSGSTLDVANPTTPNTKVSALLC